MLSTLTAMQTLERARSLMESGRGAALPELLKLIETLSLNLAEVTIPELAELIEKDAVILARVIAVANTLANNPGIAPLATLSQAIHQIGYNRIRTIAVSLMLLETAGASNNPEQREAAATALSAGLLAQGIAEALGTHDPELTFACAALRNLGLILMAAVSPELFREAALRARASSEGEAQRPLFGLTAVELSRQLLTQGRLPADVLHALRECEPESIGGSSASAYDSRLLGIADFGSRLAGLVLDARDGPEAFRFKSTELARRFERLVPGAGELIKPALVNADHRLGSFTRCSGIRSLPTVSLGRFRVRMHDLAPAGTRAAEEEIAALHPESRAPFGDDLLTRSPGTNSTRVGTPARAAGLGTSAPWNRDLLESAIFQSLGAPLASSHPPFEPWLAALATCRSAVHADECWVFLPADGAATFALAHRLLANGRLAPRAAAPLHASDRTIFGLCLTRHEIVVIHDTREARIAPYLPPWWHSVAAAPRAFALVPLREGATSRALLLLGWTDPRRVVLTTAQGALLDKIAREALASDASVPPSVRALSASASGT